MTLKNFKLHYQIILGIYIVHFDNFPPTPSFVINFFPTNKFAAAGGFGRPPPPVS